MDEKTSKLIGYSYLSDEELLSLSQKKNMHAFNELVKRYEQKIFNLGFRITQDREDASDVLQETFIQVLKNIYSFRGDSKFSTWLYRIATNTALMKKRRDKKHYNYNVPLDKPLLTYKGDDLKRQLRDESANTPFEDLEKEELKEKLREAISELPVKYRLPLVLHDVDGFSNEKASKILNISLSAVKSRIHRARFYLREKLSDYVSQHEEVNHGF